MRCIGSAFLVFVLSYHTSAFIIITIAVFCCWSVANALDAPLSIHTQKFRIAVLAQKQATRPPLLRLSLHKMYALTSLHILVMYLFHTGTIGLMAAKLVDSRNPYSSFHPEERSLLGSKSVTHLRRISPLLPPEGTFNPLTILDPPNTTSVLVAPIRISSSINNPSAVPFFKHPTAQTSPPSPHHTGFQTQEHNMRLTQFDLDQCHKNKHCLFCRDPDTVLTCYKYNCQCQHGHPAAHYMAASRESCYDSELCLSCPPRSMPFTWGRMAVCLTIFKHRPIKGGGNPLTNWTEDGVRGLPVGKVFMSKATRIERRFSALVNMARLGTVAVIYLLMV